MTDVRTISTDDLRQRLEQGTNLEFWNVLTDKSFTGEMIPGSRRMPLDTVEYNTARVPKDAEIHAFETDVHTGRLARSVALRRGRSGCRINANDAIGGVRLGV